jgi:hypothetical protein
MGADPRGRRHDSPTWLRAGQKAGDNQRDLDEDQRFAGKRGMEKGEAAPVGRETAPQERPNG